ncbi:MAG: DMT family transporter [Clostridia bacterium]|nr:DMT family transporter [Clostridia bacterium]
MKESKKTNSNPNRTGAVSLFLLFLTAMIWGFAFVAQVEGIEYIGNFTLNGTRFTVGIISLLPVVLVFERGRTDREERKRTVKVSLLAGVVLFLASSFQQLGIQYTKSAGIAGFITGLYSVFIPIACFVLFKKRTSLNVWLGVVCAVIGLFLLCYKQGEGFSFGIGELLLLVGTFFWTAHVIIIDRCAKNVRSLHFSWGQFAVCAVLGLISMFIFEEPEMSNILDAKWAILYCGVLSVGVAYTLQVIAQKRADPTLAAIVLSTESVFSAVGGFLFGIDELTVFGIAGCILMFVGIVLSQLSPKKRSGD